MTVRPEVKPFVMLYDSRTLLATQKANSEVMPFLNGERHS